MGHPLRVLKVVIEGCLLIFWLILIPLCKTTCYLSRVNLFGDSLLDSRGITGKRNQAVVVGAFG